MRGDERFARTFSFTQEEAEIGFPIERALDVIYPDDRDYVTAFISQMLQDGSPFRAEYRVRAQDEGWLWILASGRCDHDADGRPLRFPGVIVDIHDRKIAEETLRELTRGLKTRFRKRYRRASRWKRNCARA